MRILLAGGGTGGHLFPLIAVAEALRRKDPQIALLLCGRRNSLEQQEADRAKIRFLPVSAEQSQRQCRTAGDLLVACSAGRLSVPLPVVPFAAGLGGGIWWLYQLADDCCGQTSGATLRSARAESDSRKSDPVFCPDRPGGISHLSRSCKFAGFPTNDPGRQSGAAEPFRRAFGSERVVGFGSVGAFVGAGRRQPGSAQS